MQKQPNIHLWLPNIYESKGGIQAFSVFFLDALLALPFDLNFEVFLKHDSCLFLYPDSSIDFDTQVHFAGTWPLFLRTPVFATQILSSGLRQRPDLVICTHLNFTIAAHWLKRLTGIPYWAIAHGIEAWNIERPMLQAALGEADRILAVSSYTRDRLLQEQALSPEKVSILPNTFDADRFRVGTKPSYLLDRHQLDPEQPILLTVSRLSQNESYKGYNKVLEALPQIRQEIPNIHYILVGQGDDLPRLEEWIARHNLQDCVTLAGFIPNSELCDYYNLCDVFAMPSHGEGFGIVYLEAMACGKPTLAGNKDGAQDALCHGELGALVDPDDSNAIAQTLIQILQKTYPNPLMYQPEALRQEVIDRFGFDLFQDTLSYQIQQFSPLSQSLEVFA
jgi:glycosyltransferase involved in cell wall biosynthesis